MGSSEVLVSICIVLVYLGAVPGALAAVHGTARNGLLHIPSNDSLAHCATHCGDVKISYPFGVGPGCFRQGFELNCDQTAHPPRLFFRNSNTTQITSIYASYNLAFASSAVGFNVTMSQGVQDAYSMSWETPGEGVIISEGNRLYVVGCGLDVYMFGENMTDLIGSCISICADDRGAMERASVDGSCNGIGCCYISLPRNLPGFMFKLVRRNGTRAQLDDAKVFLSEEYTFVMSDLYSSWVNTSNLYGSRFEIAITDQPNCERAQVNKDSYACNNESNCNNLPSQRGYNCLCPNNRQGNPYVVNGCTPGLPSIYTSLLHFNGST